MARMPSPALPRPRAKCRMIPARLVGCRLSRVGYMARDVDSLGVLGQPTRQLLLTEVSGKILGDSRHPSHVESSAGQGTPPPPRLALQGTTAGPVATSPPHLATGHRPSLALVRLLTTKPRLPRNMRT